MKPAIGVPLPPERLLYVQEALATGSLLIAVERAGVLRRLAEGPTDIDSLAHDCGIQPVAARLLTAALANLGLIDIDPTGTCRSNSQDVLSLATLSARWSQLADAVVNERDRDRQAIGPDLMTMFPSSFSSLVKEIATLIAGTDRNILILDLFPSPWIMALSSVAPEACMCVGHVLTENDAESGGSHWSTRSSMFDLVIANDLFQLCDDHENRQVIGAAFNALKPGGRFAIVDVLPNERMDGPLPVIFHALELLVRSPHGQVYPFSVYANWLREAGFEAVERANLSASVPVSLIAARRPTGTGAEAQL